MFIKRSKYQLLLGLLSGLCTQGIMAGDQGNSLDASSIDSSPFVFTLSVGSSWAKAGATQTLLLEPEIENTYVANKNTNALASGSLFIGLQHLVHPKVLGQFGFALGTSGNAQLSGDIWENADANFNDYFYSYSVKSTFIGVKGKLLAVPDIWMVQPYLSASVGIALNQSHSYESTPKIPENAPVPPFRGENRTSLSFALGVGIQKQLNNHWSVGVGYEFADWGNSQLGSMSELTINRGLSLSNLYTNSLMFHISYLA